MPKLTVTQGFPGSGKSTWAKDAILKSKGKVVGVNRDYLRMMTGGKWWPANEGLVTEIQLAAIRVAIGAGLDVILDDTFLNQRHVEAMRNLAESLGAEFEVKSFMHVDIDTCIERDAARDRSVGKDVIERMYYDYWKQFPKPHNSRGNEAIIVDIDGTLAHVPGADPITGMLNGRYPYDRDMRDDKLDPAVYSILASQYQERDILLVSGRGEEKRAETEEWLARYNVPYFKLYMRAAGDSKRSDVLVKKDIFMDSIHDKHKVVFVLDDRPAVVRMWRAELGLKVLQVAPNLEF